MVQVLDQRLFVACLVFFANYSCCALRLRKTSGLLLLLGEGNFGDYLLIFSKKIVNQLRRLGERLLFNRFQRLCDLT
jgi:hypothetical protein